MAGSIQQMMQEMHTLIQSAMIAVPSGGRPGSIAALEFPGISVDPEEYDGSGLSDALRNLLDSGAGLDIVHTRKDARLFQFYGQILTNTQLPHGRELTTEEEQRMKVAYKYIRNNASTYIKYSEKLMEAQGALSDAKTTAERRKAKVAVRNIELEWNAHGRQRYEEYANTIRELHKSSPAAYFESAKQTYDEYSSDDCVSVIPASWYSEKEKKLSWTTVQCGQNSRSGGTSSETISTDKMLKEYYQKTDFWSRVKGWFSVKSEDEVSTSVQEIVEKTNRSFSSCGLSMKWRMARVSVQRPWLDLGILAVGGLKFPGTAPGAYSTGALSWENKGMLPGYVTDFIVAKDISMDMHVSKDMADALANNSHSVTCGPFQLGKNCTIEKVRDGSTESQDTVHLRIEVNGGAQIIGYIVTPFPRFPTE